MPQQTSQLNFCRWVQTLAGELTTENKHKQSAKSTGRKTCLELELIYRLFQDVNWILSAI